MQYLVVLATESGGSALQSLVLRGWQAVHRVGLELERGLGLISTAVSGPERLASCPGSYLWFYSSKMRIKNQEMGFQLEDSVYQKK